MLFSWRRWAEHGRRVPLRSPLLVTEDGGESPEIVYLEGWRKWLCRGEG